MSGAHDRTKALGAVYEDAGGWERPRVYGPDWEGKEPHSWKHGPSWEAAVKEAQGVHNGVGLGDFTAFSKFEITGPEAEAYLNRLCANRMPKKVGGTCLTLLLNEQGTIEGEATIARLGEDRFWFVTGGPSERRVWDWITLHQRGSEDVTIRNLSDDWGILTIAGPQARAVLATQTDASLENADFGWLKAREITVAGIPLIAMRMSFSGELAWELHAPNAQLGELWDALWNAGQPHGMVAFGSKALEMMRMEKAYRGGHELANDASPVHTDQMRFVRLDKDFVGRDAVARRAETGETSVIAYLDVDVTDSDVLGGEAVYLNGDKVGSVSSGGYGPNSDRSLAFAFLKPDAAKPGTALEISLFGDMCPATVLAEPVLDPQNERLKA
jgi:dimethylglycine dehydrogenase